MSMTCVPNARQGVAAQPRAPGNPPAPDRLSDAFRALDDASVTWCLLRGEPGGEGGDVDLLVERRHRDRALTALRSVGFAPVPSLGRGSHRFVFGFDPARGRWLKLDLVTDLAFGRHQEFRTAAAGPCLARRIRDRGLPVLVPDDAAAALLIHSLLDGRSVPEGAALAALQAIAAGRSGPLPGPIGAGVRAAVGDVDLASTPWDLVRSADRDVLAGAAQGLRTAWLRRHPIEVARRRLTNAILRGLDRRRPPFVRRGLLVALLGPDGAGKSSLVAGLRGSFPLPVRTRYLGLYAKRAGSSRERAGSGTARRLGRLWLAWIDARVAAARGAIVVFDRYAYDARIGHGGGRRRALGRWLLGHAVPGPDLVLVLDADPAVLHGRKPEHDLERVGDDVRRYRALAASLPRARLVDASRPPEEVRRRAVALIWDRLAGRGAEGASRAPAAADEG